MPLIDKEVKETSIALTVRIETSLAERLKEYSEYLESSQAHVVAESIKYVMDRDKEFAARGAAPQNGNGRAKAAAEKQRSVVA